MKAFKLALVLSVVANAILAFVVIGRTASGDRPPAVRAALEIGRADSASASRHAEVDTPGHPAARHGGAGLWAELQNLNYREVAQRLEAAGFPRRLVVAIVTGIAGERMRKQFSELAPENYASQPYWKANQSLYDDPAKRPALQKLQTEQHEQLTLALGENYWMTEERYIDFAREQYGELPVETLRAISTIERDYNELRGKVYVENEKNRKAGTPVNPAKLRLLEAEQRADLGKLLTPEQLFEYDLRSSRSAAMLRDDTGLLQISEAEFRTLFPAYQAAAQGVEAMEFATADQRNAAKRSFDSEVQAKVKELLGPERFADYLQAKDPASKKLNLIVQRLDLPLSAARAVVAEQVEVTQRADAIRSDPTLTAEQRAAQLAGLAQEASAKITGSLGERGYAAYVENSGKWLRGLQGAGNSR